MASWKLHSAGRSALALAMGFSLIGGSLVAQSPKPRKWKDATGKFEIEATLVSEANGVVTLKQTNGEEVEIELKQLSPADEAYVKTEMAASKSPFKSKAAPSPFQAKSSGKSSNSSSTSSSGSGSGMAEVIGDPEAVPVQWTNASLLQPPQQPNRTGISVTPPATKKLKSAQVPAKRDFHESFESMAVGDGFVILCYTYADTFKKGIGDSTRLVRVNLEAGKVEGTIIVEGRYRLMDVSPEGDQMLMRKEPEFAKKAKQLEIWKPAGKVVERQKTFIPFEFDNEFNHGVEQAFLGANGRIVVISMMGRAGIFDAATGEAVATSLKGNYACMTTDRKYAGILGDKTVYVVDLTTGEAVIGLPTDKNYGAVLAFSPDGKRIAAADGSSVVAWNLASGEVYRDEVVGNIGGLHTSFVWTSPDHVMAGSKLYDLENHLPLWDYGSVKFAAPLGASTVIAGSDFPPGTSVVVAAQLPHNAALAAQKQALATQGVFAVTPGTAISVDVSGLPDAGEQQKAKAGLEARLTASGLKPTPGAPIVLKASMTSANSEENYRTFGGGFDTHKINVTRYTSKVELLVGGKAAWSSMASSGPSFHINVKPNETLEDAVRNSSKPYYGFFSNIAIPSYILQPGKSTLGSSNLTGL